MSTFQLEAPKYGFVERYRLWNKITKHMVVLDTEWKCQSFSADFCELSDFPKKIPLTDGRITLVDLDNAFKSVNEDAELSIVGGWDGCTDVNIELSKQTSNEDDWDEVRELYKELDVDLLENGDPDNPIYKGWTMRGHGVEDRAEIICMPVRIEDEDGTEIGQYDTTGTLILD